MAATKERKPSVNPIISLIKDSNIFEKVIYCMLVFIPLAFIAEFAHFDSVLVFFFSCLAITPLAKIMGTATEELASKAGSGIGGLLNATFGNAVELIIAIFALLRAKEDPKLIDVVKASITGSIIGNLLFVLGLAILVGGWKRPMQTFNATAAKASNTLLTLSAVALIMPAAFSLTISSTNDAQRLQQANLLENLSLGVAVILIASYAAQLIFSLRTHSYLYGGKAHVEEEDESHGWSVRDSLIVLLVATVLVGFMAEFLVGSVESLTKSFGWTELFIGVILIAIIGNAAEHLTAVIVAMKNKMDLAFGIAVGSSTQIAAFVAPVLVFIGFFLGGNSQLNLVFSPFEVVAIVLSILIVNQVANDGETNWLEGVLSLAAYLIIAVAFYLHPPL